MFLRRRTVLLENDLNFTIKYAKNINFSSFILLVGKSAKKKEIN